MKKFACYLTATGTKGIGTTNAQGHLSAVIWSKNHLPDIPSATKNNSSSNN